MRTFRCLCTFHLRGTSEDDNIMRRLLNPQTKAERSATVENSLSCEHVHQDFCCRWATGAFLAILTSLVGLCKLIFVTASFQSYAFVQRRQRIVYLSQLPIRKPTRKARRFWIRLGRTQQWWRTLFYQLNGKRTSKRTPMVPWQFSQFCTLR